MRGLLILLAACGQSGTVAIDAALSDASLDDADTPAFLFLGSSSLQDFGSVPIGQSIQLDVIVTNGGVESTGNLSPAVTGTDAASFLLPNIFCGELSNGQSCDYNITFAPTTTGSKVATMSVTATPGGTVNVALKGAGLTTGLSVSLPSVTFTTTTVGNSSAPAVVTVTNISSLTSDAVAVSIAGANAAQFSIVTNSCTVLAPSATCTVTMEFTPSSATTSTATLEVTADVGTVTAALTGIGTP